MRTLISSVGTRGDVQPAIALARELKSLGHEPRLCVPPNFVNWAKGLGCEAFPIGIEMRPPARGSGPQAPIPDLIKDQFDTIEAASRGRDLIVACGPHQYAARSIAELREIPYVVAVLAPTSLPRLNLTPPGVPDQSNDSETNGRMWQETRRSWNDRSMVRVNTNRVRLGLPEVDDVLNYILTGRPWLAADVALTDLTPPQRDGVFQTGAWILPDTQPLSSELDAFLLQGESPVYLGFGSMPAAGDTSRKLISGVRAAGRRIVLSRGWAELGLIDDRSDCISIGEVNQQLLFPRVALVVHHGGAGTTAAAARAGVPQVVVPQFTDQFYWASRIRDLGAGSTVRFANLEVETLGSALKNALSPRALEGAHALSRTIDSNGAAIAANRLVEDYG
jgi:vancomycin aglycone glucosyltransferase